MRISGFTIVRNAEILEYPFVESVESAIPLCQEFIINCGDSTDNTWKICQQLKEKYPAKIKLIQSVWKKENQSGGYQLKAQTDAALKECTQSFCLYIQADEVLHENDYAKIISAAEYAAKEPHIDGIVFDYLHFYGNYFYTIKGRNWYRKEVRLFKNGRGIEAFRDAQGFRKNGKRLLARPVNAKVFHYGYVRSPKSLETKSTAMSQWWGAEAAKDESAYQLRRHVGIRRFTGTHPRVMDERVIRRNPPYDPARAPRVWDKDEIKNALTLIWESIIPYRIGEFKNYEIKI